MAKLNREALMHFLNTKFTTAPTGADWEWIGDDIEELAVELNPDTETFKNIKGQTKVTDNGYEPSIDADPYYADSSSKLYEPLRDIALDRKKGDACKTLLLEVIVEDVADTDHLAYIQEVIVKPQSYGGGAAGVNIPFNIMEDGERKKGTVKITAGVPVFTATA